MDRWLTALFCGLFSAPLFASSFPTSWMSEAMGSALRGETMDISSLPPGESWTGELIGTQVMLYRRTPADIQQILQAAPEQLADPEDDNLPAQIRRAYSGTARLPAALLLQAGGEIAKDSPYRSVSEQVLVVNAAAPDTGCLLRHMRSETGTTFLDPCSNSLFDSAGRKLRAKASEQSAAFNLAVIPHYFQQTDILFLGFNTKAPLGAMEYRPAEEYKALRSDQLLLKAASYNDKESLLRALSQGATANTGNSVLALTPLNAAVLNSSTEIVQILLDRGALPDYRSMQIARYLKRTDVIELLQPYSAEM